MELIGKYAVIKELGLGGFGAVYLAEDPKFGEQAAIKLFKVRDANLAGQVTSASSDTTGVLKKRFLDEAKILRQLSTSPYIVEVYDFDELEDGSPYYVMPFFRKILAR